MFGPTWWPYSFLTIPATSLAFAVGSLLSTLRMARLLLFLGSERSDDAFLAIHYLEVESKGQHKVSLCQSMVKIALQSVSLSADLVAWASCPCVTAWKQVEARATRVARVPTPTEPRMFFALQVSVFP